MSPNTEGLVPPPLKISPPMGPFETGQTESMFPVSALASLLPTLYREDSLRIAPETLQSQHMQPASTLDLSLINLTLQKEDFGLTQLHAGASIKSTSEMIAQGEAIQRAYVEWSSKMKQTSPETDKATGFIGTIPLPTAQLKQAMGVPTSDDLFFHNTCKIEDLDKHYSLGASARSMTSTPPLFAHESIVSHVATSPSVLRMHAFLFTTTTSMNDKLYAHLVGHGNAMISKGRVDNVKLEGISYFETISYQLDVAETLLKALKQTPDAVSESFSLCCGSIVGDPVIGETIRQDPKLLTTLIHQLKIAKEIADIFGEGLKASESKSLQNDNFLKFRTTMIKQIEELKPGESFYFPGGWVTSGGGGHATAWGITKQKDGRLTIRFHNTGDGVEYHASQQVGWEDRYLLFTEIENVGIEHFTSYSFLQGIYNIQTQVLKTKGWSAREIYKSLLFGLEGQVSSKLYSLSELAKPQFVGICAMESTMAAASTALESETSMALFRFWSTFKGTVSYFEAVKDTLVIGPGSEERRLLLYDGLKVFSKLTDNAADAGTLSDQELDYTRSVIQQMQQHLIECQKQAIDVFAEDEPVTLFSVSSQSLDPLLLPSMSLYLKKGIKRPEKLSEMRKLLQAMITIYNSRLQYSPDPTLKVAPKKVKEVVRIKTEDFVPIPTTLSKDLKNLVGDIHLSNHQRQDYLEVQAVIRSIILKLPPLDDVFWTKLTEKDANELIKTFAELSKEMLWSLLHNGKEVLMPDVYICQAKLLALTDKLLHHYDNPLGIKLPSLFQSSISSIIPHGTLEWGEQYHDIMNYWKKSSAPRVKEKEKLPREPDFFRFDEYSAASPAGIDYLRRFDENPNLLSRLSKSSRGIYKILPDKWRSTTFKDDDNYKINKYFLSDFLKKWVIDHPKIAASIDPDFAKKNPEEQARFLIANLDKLPALHSAFIVSYAYDFLLTGQFTTREGKDFPFDFSKGIQIDVDHFRGRWDDGLIYELSGFTYLLFGSAPPSKSPSWPAVQSFVSGASLVKGQTAAQGYLQKLLFRDKTKLQDSSEFTSKEDFDWISRLRVDSREVFEKFQQKEIVRDESDFSKLGISQQHYQELMALSSDPTVQIDQTIGYFTENPHLFFKTEFQILFRLLMCEDGLLKEWIKGNAHAASDLAKFYQKNLIIAQRLEDDNSVIFLIDMSSRLEELYRNEKEKNPSTFLGIEPPNFLKGRQILRDLIQKLSSEERYTELAVLFRNLVLTFRSQKALDAESAAELIVANIQSRLYLSPAIQRDDHDANRELDLIVRDRFSYQLEILMQGEQCDQILSKVLKSLVSEEQMGVWSSPDKFPYYVSPKGDYVINILEGTYSKTGERSISFPPKLLENPSIKEIFGDHPPPSIRLKGQALLMESRQGSFRIVASEPLKDPILHMEEFSKTARIQFKFRGHWYELQDSRYNKGIGKNIALAFGKHVWYHPGSSATESISLIFTDKVSGKVIYRMILDEVIYRLILKSDRVNEIIKMNELGHMVDSTLSESDVFRMMFESDQQIVESDQSVKQIIKLNEFEQDTDLHLVDSTSSELDAFRRLEAPEYILAWRKEGVLSQVELPRFDLTFSIKEVNGKRHAVCDEFPGYVLAEGEKQFIPSLGNLRHYLHLKRPEKDGSVSELVIFARQDLLPSKEGSFLTDIKPDRKVNRDKMVRQKRYEYQVIKGELVPKATAPQEVIESTLFLAMTHLSEKYSDKDKNPYAQARHYLEKANELILRQREPLSPSNVEILKKWILAIPEKSTIGFLPREVFNDLHPDAIALRLKALYILFRNQKDYSLAEDVLPPMGYFRTDFIGYQTHRSLVDKAFHLSEVEEADLIRIMEIKPVITLPASVMPTLNLKEINPIFPETWTAQLEAPRRDPSDDSSSDRSTFLCDIDAPHHFMTYFSIARGELHGKEAIQKLNNGMGLHLSEDLSEAEILKEMRIALKLSLTASDSTEEGDDWFTLVLLGVVTQPEKYPKTKQLHLQIEKLKALETQDKDTIRNWLVNNLQKPTESLRDSGALDLKLKTALTSSGESARLKREKEAAKVPQSPKKDLTFAECTPFQSGLHLSYRTINSPIIPQKAQDQFLREILQKQDPTSRITPAELLSVKPKNPLIGNVFKEVQNDLEKYQAANKEAPNYEITDPEKVSELCTTMQKEIVELEKDLLMQERALFELANHGPSRIGEEAIRDLQIQRGAEVPITIDELNRAFFHRDLEILHKRNPHLSREEMTELFTRIENFLLTATHLQHEKRVLKQGKNIKTALDQYLTGVDLQETIRSFVSIANAIRHYDPHKHPEYLTFEYYTDILMWKPQVDKLSSLDKQEKFGALIELAMALGKSKVISPLIGWMLADGDQLSSLVTTEELLPAMVKEVQETSGKVFAQQVRTLAIKRDPITTKRLQRLLDNLNDIRLSRQELIWTAGDILSLFNQWVEMHEYAREKFGPDWWQIIAAPTASVLDWPVNLFRQFTQWIGLGEAIPQTEFSKQRNLFLKIFKLLREKSVMTIDEIHKVFDILQAHSFTFGAPQSVHADVSSAVMVIFDTILADKDLHEKFRWEFLPQSKGDSFTEENYQENIKAQIINSIIQRGVASEDAPYQEVFKKLDTAEIQQLKDYLSNGKDAIKGYNFLENLEKSKGIDPITAKKIRNQCATLKEVLNNILPRTAGKKPLVHYGEDAEQIQIIPYHDGVPTVNSLFGSILERLIYTAQYGLHQGVSEDIVKQEILRLKEQADLQKNLGRIPDLSEFDRLLGGRKDKRFSLFKFHEKSDFTEITKEINQNPESILKLIKDIRFPKVKMYTKEIESSAHLIPLLSRPEQGIRGFSGTLYNVPTFPKVFQPTESSNTQAKTLTILMEKSNLTVATLPSMMGKNDAEKIKLILDQAPGTMTSTIDASGALSGCKNEKLARAMLDILTAGQASPKIQGIVYYDGDIQKVVTLKNKHPILYDKSTDRESLAGLWDLPHITGSDIPVGQFTKAVMLVGKDNTLVSLMQAAWRLRGLDKGQSVHFIVPHEDKQIIRKMLCEHLGVEIAENADLTLPQVIQYALLNQALQESYNTYQATQESMKVALIKRLVNILWDPAISDQDASKIWEDSRLLFVKETPQEPWDLYGRPVQEILTSESLQNLLNGWKKHPVVKKIKEDLTLYKGIDFLALYEEWDRIIENISGPLPEKVKEGVHSYGKITEQQVEQAVEQQVEKQIKYESKNEKIVSRARIPFPNPFIKPTPISLSYLDSISEIFLFETVLYYLGSGLRMDDLLSLNPSTKNLSPAFDDDLLASLNVAPAQKAEWEGQRKYVPFSEWQKPITFVQVTQDKTGKLTLQLIDERDAARLREILQEDRAKGPSQGHEVRVGLYQIQKNTYRLDTEGKEKINLEDPKTKQRFMELLVQAKFAAGTVNFSDEEIPYLKKWIEKISPLKALELIKVILNPIAKSDRRKTFSKSTLAKIFVEFGIEVDTLAKIT